MQTKWPYLRNMVYLSKLSLRNLPWHVQNVRLNLSIAEILKVIFTCNASAFFSPSPSRAAASSNLPCCLRRLSCSLSFAIRACLSCSDSLAQSAAPTCFSSASRSSLSLNVSYLSSRAFRSSSSWKALSSTPRRIADNPSSVSSCQEVCSCKRRRESSWMSCKREIKPHLHDRKTCYKYLKRTEASALLPLYENL